MKPGTKVALVLAGMAFVLPVASFAWLGLFKETSADGDHARQLHAEVATRLEPRGAKVYWSPRVQGGPVLSIFGVPDPAEQQAAVELAQAACQRIKDLPGARIEFLAGAPLRDGVVTGDETKLAIHKFSC